MQPDRTLDKPEHEDGHELRSFGRRRGRKLSPRQDTLLHELLPRIGLDLSRAAATQLGEPGKSLWLEIGFGGAEHLIWQAENNPDTLLIGCEPFEEGVVKTLSAIEQKSLSNIRLHADDARDVLRWLPAASLDRCFILFPDPWPKKRHAKRRLVSPALLQLLAHALRDGSELRIGTDIGDYARTVLLAVQSSPHFRWEAKTAADWRVRPSDWPQTRYESKAHREGRRCYFLSFRKTATL